jgi:hypothetical protein
MASMIEDRKQAIVWRVVSGAGQWIVRSSANSGSP